MGLEVQWGINPEKKIDFLFIASRRPSCSAPEASYCTEVWRFHFFENTVGAVVWYQHRLGWSRPLLGFYCLCSGVGRVEGGRGEAPQQQQPR